MAPVLYNGETKNCDCSVSEREHSAPRHWEQEGIYCDLIAHGILLSSFKSSIWRNTILPILGLTYKQRVH